MGCGSCQKRKEEFLKRQGKVDGQQPLYSYNTPNANPSNPQGQQSQQIQKKNEPVWRFAKHPRKPLPSNNDQLMVQKEAERLLAIQQKANLPQEPKTLPYRKTN